MNPDTFCWFIDLFAFNSGIISYKSIFRDSYSSLHDHRIECPLVVLMCTTDFLTSGGQETLRIEESSQPEGDWSVLHEPGSELIFSVNH
jgi:hypothetical protein